MKLNAAESVMSIYKLLENSRKGGNRIMKKRRFFIGMGLLLVAATFTWGAGQCSAQTPDYTKPNYANSPPLHKFIDRLPGLGPGGANNLGQYIPIATPDTATFPGSDYYEIGLKDYTKQMHTDLPPTKLRGYYQINGTDHSSQYLGPLILAARDRPVRVKFTPRCLWWQRLISAKCARVPVCTEDVRWVQGFSEVHK